MERPCRTWCCFPRVSLDSSPIAARRWLLVISCTSSLPVHRDGRPECEHRKPLLRSCSPARPSPGVLGSGIYTTYRPHVGHGSYRVRHALNSSPSRTYALSPLPAWPNSSASQSANAATSGSRLSGLVRFMALTSHRSSDRDRAGEQTTGSGSRLLGPKSPPAGAASLVPGVVT